MVVSEWFFHTADPQRSPCPMYVSSPPSPYRAARCVITQFANKSSQNVNLSLVNTLFIGSMKRKRERERSGGSGALESAPVQFWDYRTVSIVSASLCVCVRACLLCLLE